MFNSRMYLNTYVDIVYYNKIYQNVPKPKLNIFLKNVIELGITF